MSSTSTPRAAWQLQDAKARFSALVRQAQQQGPQHISVHGKPAVVVLSDADYRRLQARSNKPSFTKLMRESPFVGLELSFERDRSLVRRADLEP